MMRKQLFLASLLWLSLVATAQQQWVLTSKHLARPDTVWVFTPAQTDDQKLPVLFLLHGYGGSFRQWHQLLQLQDVADRYHLAVVCPDGLYDSWYFDSPQVPASHYEQFFVHQLVPEVLQRLPADAQRLYIDGLSMGGHGALYLFLRHPELFAAAGSTSGVLDLKCSRLRDTSLARHLGPYQPQTWRSHTALGQLAARAPHTKPMIIDCGRQDYVLPCNQAFVQQATQAGYRVVYTEQDGQHNNDYWRTHFYQHLEFYKRLPAPVR